MGFRVPPMAWSSVGGRPSFSAEMVHLHVWATFLSAKSSGAASSVLDEVPPGAAKASLIAATAARSGIDGLARQSPRRQLLCCVRLPRVTRRTSAADAGIAGHLCVALELYELWPVDPS